MTWLYNGKEFNDNSGHIGFVYSITGNGKSYIGKKNFWQYRTPKGKKNKVKSESNWRNYWSSCNELKLDLILVGKEHFTREILVLCDSIREMTYCETALQFKLDVLKDDLFYNTNINGKYYHWFSC